MSLIERKRRVHFVGMGGIGMSGIAELLLALGHSVSGSDIASSETLDRLKKLGAKVQVPHGDEILRESRPDVLVYSTAINPKNPELLYALDEKIPVIRRAEMLAELMRLKRGIAIAGSHGKTTTTGLVSLLLKAGALNPTVVIGGKFSALGSNAALGKGAWLVAEADESDGSFLRLQPEIAVVTNIDHEHLDHYKRFEGVLNAFGEFIDKVPFYGRAILCSDCENVRSLRDVFRKPVIFYGLDPQQKPDFLVKIVSEGATPSFEIIETRKGDPLIWARVSLKVPGRHNMLNATAAALVARELDIPVTVIEQSLADFTGVERRFQKRGEMGTFDVIEDYAHHPTEIRATLQAALSAYGGQNLIVAFQPHRYSRTRDSWAEFKTCFAGASKVFTLPIYPASEAREEWTKDYDGQNFCANISDVPTQFCSTREELGVRIQAHAQEFSRGAGGRNLLLVLGAGDIPKIIPDLLGNLRS